MTRLKGQDCLRMKAIESRQISKVAQEQLRLIGRAKVETVKVGSHKKPLKPDTTPEHPSQKRLPR